MTGLSSPALQRFVRRPAAEAGHERCELCGETLPDRHRHLLDLERRSVLCGCRACSLLFDPDGAGGKRYRLIGDRRRRLDDLTITDDDWAAFGVPVRLAYFTRDTRAGRVRGFYPSPLGPTETVVSSGDWARLEERDAVLAAMQPDVESLLVDRRDGASRQYLVPIEDCYSLVAVVRTHWRGLAGGDRVWEEIDAFFARLDEQST